MPEFLKKIKMLLHTFFLAYSLFSVKTENYSHINLFFFLHTFLFFIFYFFYKNSHQSHKTRSETKLKLYRGCQFIYGVHKFFY